MWNGGNPANHADETARRLSIEMALAQHGAARAPPYHYGYEAQSEYQRQIAMQSYPHPAHHHPHHSRHPPPPHSTHPHRPGGPPPPGAWDRRPSPALPPPHPPPSTTDTAPSVNEAKKKEPALIHPRGKPEVMAAKLASAPQREEKDDQPEAEKSDKKKEAELQPPKKTEEKKKPRKKSTGSKTSPKLIKSSVPTMDDPIKPITAAEYENLQALLVQFCRVPLLAEFSRPVSLLHPELMNIYSKIVHHPVDLGKVCRKIRRKQYKCLRDVRLDAWRIFSNCVKYHSHPSNKEAVPSFVSIALHLRDYFNELWQEHMISSDPVLQDLKPAKLQTHLREATNKRKEDRKKRLMVSGLSVMTGKCLERAGESLHSLIDTGGCVDKLDMERVWGNGIDEADLDVVVDNLVRLKNRLSDISSRGEEYGVDELDRDVRQCYMEDVLENNPAVRLKVANRLDRFIGKIIVPIHEGTCRGVSQSSIWGCMAAAVWARESSKKPYWPALVLGIMAPDDQKEEWHMALTERNENRLPEKLRTQLTNGKRKSEQAIKRQNLGQLDPQSYFLIEFLGTHEFIWVKESDIVENFDPKDDPNQHPVTPGSKKKRASRSSIANVLGSKIYNSAVEEGKWALEEFELQLQDIGNDGTEEEEDGEEMNYSYSVLCQSDDEADEEAASDDEDIPSSDLEESNELLAMNGLIDYTSFGRKNAKKKAQAAKKQKVDAEKKQKAKLKAEQTKKRKDAKAKEREMKQQEKDLDKKRKKRARERDKALKGSEQKSKKRRVSDSEDLKKAPSGRRHLIAGKRDRANAIVDGYLKRAMDKEDYRSLCNGGGVGGGVMTIPASLIDSSGLLGMALAFRAAAGEIPMPIESGDQNTNIRPWDAIKAENQKKCKDREFFLEKQIALLEKEIELVKSNTAKRLELAKEAKAKNVDMIELIVNEDVGARQNPLAKRKNSLTPGKKGKQGSTAATSPNSNSKEADRQEAKREDNEGDVEMEAVVDEVEAETKSTDTKKVNGEGASGEDTEMAEAVVFVETSLAENKEDNAVDASP